MNQHGNHARGLRLIAPEDARVFAAIPRGEHLLCGFTDGDLQTCLFETPAKTPKQRSRRCSWVNRRLRILRRHGLIRKVGKRRLYRISPKGHRTMSLALALRDASADDLKVA